MMIITKKDMLEHPQENLRPHVVLLGAGASRAAFPNGDGSSRPIPLMCDLVENLGLKSELEKIGETDYEDFELLYAKLYKESRFNPTKERIERTIFDYFSSLTLPEEATIYDHLLLSLRKGDAVFTFNWDPFLFDAYKRNIDVAMLPEIFFLHGNVRIKDAPLLYPIEKKGYSNNPYISDAWKNARCFFEESMVLTIFGYSAPTSDHDAVELLKSAWTRRSERELEHVEIIDIAKSNLYERWNRFTPTCHLHIRRNFRESWMARWPRRSREAVFFPMKYGAPCQDFPLYGTENLVVLQKTIREIAGVENDGHL